MPSYPRPLRVPSPTTGTRGAGDADAAADDEAADAAFDDALSTTLPCPGVALFHACARPPAAPSAPTRVRARATPTREPPEVL